jgi:hypothetical protein
MHLPGLGLEYDGSSPSEEEEEDEYDYNDLLGISDLDDDELLEGISFTEDDRNTARNGGGYEPDNNGRSPTLTEFTQDENMSLQTDGDPQTEKPANMDTANINEVKMKNEQILSDLQRKYGLSFNKEDRIHNDRLLMIKRIENAVLTIAEKNGDSEEIIKATMNLMLKGNRNKIASQPILKTRLLKFETDNGISKTHTSVKPSASKSVPSTRSPSSNDKQQEASIESALKNICNKYGIKSPRHTWMMHTAYLDKFTEMSKLVDKFGKINNFDKKQLDRYMYFKVVGKDGHFLSNMQLIYSINKLSNQLETGQNTRVSKTPRTA